MVNKERLLKIFLSLVRQDSPSLKERTVANKIKQILTEYKIEVFEDDTADKISGESGNIICRLPSNVGAYERDDTFKDNSYVPGIMFSAHMDTVTPCSGKNIIVNEDKDIIYTDGKTILGGDDVAGISSIIEAFISLKEMDAPHGDLWGVFTVAEEIGLLGSRHIDLEKTGINAKYCYVLDSGGPIGTCDIQGPAQNMIKLRFRGKAAHAGLEPEKGINAIVTASEAIASFPQGRIDEETTCNVGIISGGTATNIVCDNVAVEAEVRSCSEDKLRNITDEILQKAAEACSKRGGEVSMETSLAYPAFKISVDSEILKNFSKACSQLGINPVFEKTGGGSDTNFYNAKGITAVNLSVGMDKVHTVSECIKISDLNKACSLVYELCWHS